MKTLPQRQRWQLQDLSLEQHNPDNSMARGSAPSSPTGKAASSAGWTDSAKPTAAADLQLDLCDSGSSNSAPCSPSATQYCSVLRSNRAVLTTGNSSGVHSSSSRPAAGGVKKFLKTRGGRLASSARSSSGSQPTEPDSSNGPLDGSNAGSSNLEGQAAPQPSAPKPPAAKHTAAKPAAPKATAAARNSPSKHLGKNARQGNAEQGHISRVDSRKMAMATAGQLLAIPDCETDSTGAQDFSQLPPGAQAQQESEHDSTATGSSGRKSTSSSGGGSSSSGATRQRGGGMQQSSKGQLASNSSGGGSNSSGSSRQQGGGRSGCNDGQLPTSSSTAGSSSPPAERKFLKAGAGSLASGAGMSSSLPGSSEDRPVASRNAGSSSGTLQGPGGAAANRAAPKQAAVKPAAPKASAAAKSSPSQSVAHHGMAGSSTGQLPAGSGGGNSQPPAGRVFSRARGGRLASGGGMSSSQPGSSEDRPVTSSTPQGTGGAAPKKAAPKQAPVKPAAAANSPPPENLGRSGLSGGQPELHSSGGVNSQPPAGHTFLRARDGRLASGSSSSGLLDLSLLNVPPSGRIAGSSKQKGDAAPQPSDAVNSCPTYDEEASQGSGDTELPDYAALLSGFHTGDMSMTAVGWLPTIPDCVNEVSWSRDSTHTGWATQAKLESSYESKAAAAAPAAAAGAAGDTAGRKRWDIQATEESPIPLWMDRPTVEHILRWMQDSTRPEYDTATFDTLPESGTAGPTVSGPAVAAVEASAASAAVAAAAAAVPAVPAAIASSNAGNLLARRWEGSLLRDYRDLDRPLFSKVRYDSTLLADSLPSSPADDAFVPRALYNACREQHRVAKDMVNKMLRFMRQEPGVTPGDVKDTITATMTVAFGEKVAGAAVHAVYMYGLHKHGAAPAPKVAAVANVDAYLAAYVTTEPCLPGSPELLKRRLARQLAKAEPKARAQKAKAKASAVGALAVSEVGASGVKAGCLSHFLVCCRQS